MDIISMPYYLLSYTKIKARIFFYPKSKRGRKDLEHDRPPKVAKAVIAMDTSYSLQKLSESKQKSVNTFLAKLNHYTSLYQEYFIRCSFSQVKYQKYNKLISLAGPWNLAMDDFLQRTLYMSPALCPRAQVFKSNSSLVKRDIGLRHKEAVLTLLVLTVIFTSLP